MDVLESWVEGIFGSYCKKNYGLIGWFFVRGSHDQCENV